MYSGLCNFCLYGCLVSALWLCYDLWLCRISRVELWILSILLMLLVPPCGFISLLCLMLSQRSRRIGATSSSNVTAVCLERMSYTTVTVALCILLAVNFYTERLYRTRLLHYLASSDCMSDGTNSTVSASTVGSFPLNKDDHALLQDHPSSLDDPLIRQRFVSNNNLSVLQSSVDMELSVVYRNDVLLLPHLHANSSSPFTVTQPWLKSHFMFLFFSAH